MISTHASAARLALAFAGLVAAGAVHADGMDDGYDPRVAHEECDQNQDGLVDRGEFHQRIVEVFYHADSNKDGYLSEAEVRNALPRPKNAKGADANKDGRISLYEFLEDRFALFEDVDGDKNARLSQSEVVEAWEAE